MKHLWFILLLGCLAPSPGNSCPTICSCTYKVNSHILINCTNLNIDDYPSDASLSQVNKLLLNGASYFNVIIDLSRNKIAHVSFLPYLKSLSTIDLSHNDIITMKNITVNGTESVKELNLSHNKKLKKLTTNLRSETLEILSVTGCSINEVEKGFLESVPSLKSLDISYNSLTELSSFVSSNPEETKELDEISYENKRLLKRLELTFLNVSHNNIKKIHGKELSRTKIKVLDVSSNNIVHFRFTENLRHLEELYASDNNLRNLDGMNLPNAIVLDVSRNKLNNLIMDFDLKAPKLKILDLSYNSLGKLPKILSSSITDLNLSHCRIKSIEDQAFSSLENLKRLNLAGNELSALQYEQLLNMKNLEFLQLESNPWHCDCETKEFENLFKFVLKTFSDEAKELQCENDNLTWSVACAKVLQDEDDLYISKRASFYALIYSFTAILLAVTTILCWKCIRNIRHSDQITFQNNVGTMSDSEYEDTTTPVSDRATTSSNVDSHLEQRQIQLVRKSTPPPNYEAALLLPVLTEEQRETAMSTLSLQNT